MGVLSSAAPRVYLVLSNALKFYMRPLMLISATKMIYRELYGVDLSEEDEAQLRQIKKAMMGPRLQMLDKSLLSLDQKIDLEILEMNGASPERNHELAVTLARRLDSRDKASIIIEQIRMELNSEFQRIHRGPRNFPIWGIPAEA